MENRLQKAKKILAKLEWNDARTAAKLDHRDYILGYIDGLINKLERMN